MSDQPNQDSKDHDQTPNDSPEYTEYLGLKLADVSKQIKDEFKVAEKFVRPKGETWRKEEEIPEGPPSILWIK